MPKEKYVGRAVNYFRDNARAFEEVRLAAAGLETVQQKAPKIDLWHKDMAAMRNDDGTYGKGPGMARDTASAAVTLMRLDAGALVPKERILQVIKAGQRQNGGWGKADSEIASDLETTYRVMRCFMMLKAQPDNVEGVRSFVAKCRNADGGYGIAPGKASSVGAAYFAAITLHWLKAP
ncbi:MAG: terpene cyclase/mutase family protein [Planctomycetes bacterium]|nr:terpene cyclase/mutase family protein [Planctomycetota bacterium]